MTTPHLFVGLDLGTSAAKAVAFDRHLAPVAEARVAIATASDASGRSEQDPREAFTAAARALARVLRDVSPRRVAGIGLAAHRSSATLIDVKSGAFLSPLVLWNDRRAALIAAKLERTSVGRRMAQTSGIPVLPYTFACRARWMLERPAWRKALESGRARLVTADAALAFFLAGGGALVTDPSLSSRTQLARSSDGAWSAALLRDLGIERAWLPAVLPSVAARGFTSARFTRGLPAGVPIVASVADQSASALGIGAATRDAVFVTFGTGAFAVRGRATLDRSRGRFPILLADDGARVWRAVEANDPSTGTSVRCAAEWLGMRSVAELERRAAGSRDDSIDFVPAATGLGAPWLAPNARAAWHGLHAGATRADLAAAVLRGVALRIAELADELDPARTRPIVAAGGGASSDAMLQRVADVSGRRVERSAAQETTARGAALLAAVATGAIARVDDRCGYPGTSVTLEPRTPPLLRRQWRERFAACATVAAESRTPKIRA